MNRTHFFIRALLLGAAILVPTALTQAEEMVGTLGGKVTIDNHGAANYSIPLPIPPGRCGMQPKLALVYSSVAGNGPLGVGFSLSTGFPQSITRGRSLLARDGVVRGVEFTATDRFYLDGKLLICTSGTYGLPGSTYRTEVDSFVKITTSGTGTNIETFVLSDKSGMKMTFGEVTGANDGYQVGALIQSVGVYVADTLAYTYALKRVEDTLGNFITFIYTRPTNSYSEYELSQIDYTGGTGITAQASVILAYEARNDAPVTYVAGRSFEHNRRLKTITGLSKGSPDTTTAIYTFAYNYGAMGGRSRLYTVTPQWADPASGALQACSATTLNWEDKTVGFDATNTAFDYTLPASITSTWNFANCVLHGDFNGDGKEDYAYWDASGSGDISVCLAAGTGYAASATWITKTNITATIGGSTLPYVRLMTGDINGDGRTDIIFMPKKCDNLYAVVSSGSGFTGLTGAATPTLIANILPIFMDPPIPGLYVGGGHIMIDQAQEGVYSHITVADFTGDGRDDIAVHGFDGYLYLFESAGASYIGRGKVSSAPITIPATFAYELKQVHNMYVLNTDTIHVDYGPNLQVTPCDINGDGRMDYVYMQIARSFRETDPVILNVPQSYTVDRTLSACQSRPDGTFSIPGYIWASHSPRMYTYKQRDEVCEGVIHGDFNGDGLTDFLVQSWNPSEGRVWYMIYSTGKTDSANGNAPLFLRVTNALTRTVTINNELDLTYWNPITQNAWNGWINLTSANELRPPTMYEFQTLGALDCATLYNTFAADVNGDGMDDLVWYVGSNAAEGATVNAGWWAMLSNGRVLTPADGANNPGFGFSAPIKLAIAGLNAGWTTTASQYAFQALMPSMISDVNGDGHPDITATQFLAGRVNGYQTALSTSTTFSDTLKSVTNGLGSTVSIGYKAAKDASVYTSGAAVSYPIRELRSSQPVVSEVWHDSGTGVAADRAHFLYQYSGRRLDLSGRGDLGFHSFVTLDTQTNVFKYQFLTQSFPMTGLSAREQTYRYWPSGSGGSTANFRLISSHDNTVVFDKVVNGAGGAAYGTLYPFVAKAVESRWEDAATAHFSYTASGPSSHPENLFPAALPSGAHITITSESLFDNQTAVQTTLPTAVAAAGYNPSDTTSLRQNAVAGTTSFGTFSTLPGAITYGNLTQLKTDYGDGYTEKVVTTYKAGQTLGGVLTLTGLADTVTTTLTSTDFGTETAPVKTYGYQPGTPLVTSEAIDAPGTALDFTTTHTRDGLGRITATTVTGTDLLAKGGGSTTVTPYQATAFDPKFDLPTTEKDAYGHTTTTTYDPILGLPTSVTGPNGDTVTTQYDALGRVVGVTDAFDQSTASTYAWTTADATDWKKTQTVTPPAGVGGLTLTSAYAVQVAPDAKPIVTTYYDRLGRPIRTVKAAFGGSTLADTVYNTLGQAVAVSNPYPAGGTVYWTKTTYDALGRVSTVAAPNGTVTTTTYNGRATLVSVDAPSLGGVDPAEQVNATLVDAKGRTVKVWNADNVPTFTSTLGATTTAPSIAFDLDGFGRMRTTTLKGQTATITATYDALGRQATLDDPDKGAWSYVNSALGYVLQQTDARGTVTQTTYDPLGRPLGRTTQEASSGPLETANWFYYDSTADPTTHRVALGDKGWIGALQREEAATSGAPGYAAAHSATTTVHYYDAKGRPSIDLTTIDGKYFYTYTAYDSSNRVSQVRHYWRPAGQEAPDQSPYVWQDFGYSYTYDTKSYLLSIQDTATPARTWWQADSTAGYDYLDRPALVKKGSNWTQRTYRPTDGVLTAIKTGPTAGSTTIQNLSFDYDGLGNLRSRSGSGGTETLDYDGLNRLTSSKQGAITYFDNGNIKKKADVAGTPAPADFGYDPAHPHAVASAFGYALGYDANGNLTSRTKTGESWNFRYAGFDKPRWMAKTVGATTVGSEFLYNANRSRTVQLEFTGLAGGAPSGYVRKRVYGLGSTLEANYDNTAASGAPAWALKKVRIYVPGPDGIVGSREFDPAAPVGSQEKAFIYHYDHLGSIESITPFVPAGSGLAADSTGKPGRFSEDAWGARRDPTDWTGAPTTTDDGGADSLTPRGFTGHEMLDDLGLVHMNGRIYDPVLGRFLSGDLQVQYPGDLQSYNRYSYVRNNPLSLIDPTGFGDASAQALTLLPAAPLVVPFIPELTVTAAVTGAPSATVVFGIRAAAAAPGFSGGNMYGGFGAANYGWSKVASQQVSAQADNQSNAPKPEVDNAKPQEVSSGGQMDPDHDPKKSDDVKRDANGQLRDGKGRFASDPDNPPNPSDYSTTDRRNDWKAESTNPTREYSPEDMARMKKGLPPQRFNPITGNVESMERSHEPVPRRDGGKQTVPRWPDEHAAVDPHRQLKKQPPPPPPPPLQKDKDKEHQ